MNYLSQCETKNLMDGKKIANFHSLPLYEVSKRNLFEICKDFLE